MAVVFTAEVSLDGITATPNPDPSITFPPGFGTQPAFYTAAALIVSDYQGNRWLARFGVTPTDSSGGPVSFKSDMRLIPRGNKTPTIDAPDPWTWGFGFQEASATSPGSGAYLSGGTITVTKDLNTSQIKITTPIGTAAGLLTANDGLRLNSALNNTPLIPIGIGLYSIVPQDGGVHNPEATDSHVRFYNFYARRNGLITFGHPLSAADPGLFNATADASFDVFGSPSSDPASFFTESQLTSRYTMDIATTIGVYPVWAQADFWRLFATVPPQTHSTDMDRASSHGVVWRGGTDIDDGTVMLVQRTFDNAGSWETWTAFSDPSASNDSPTVTWYNERLNLTWFDGTNIRENHSLDGGINWSVPTTIPFTGTNPRRVVDRTGGGAFYFYFGGGSGDDLLVVITYDNGASWEGPYTVAGTVGAQQIDAEFMPDGSLVASLFVAGVWTQYRSRDLGHTWS